MHEYRPKYGATADDTFMQIYVLHVTVVNAMLKIMKQIIKSVVCRR